MKKIIELGNENNNSYLEKTSGVSFADLTTLLAQARIEHCIPNGGMWAETEYFRDSYVKISADQEIKLVDLIWAGEFPNFHESNLEGNFYYAHYEIIDFKNKGRVPHLVVERSKLMIATEEETEEWFRQYKQ